MDQERTERLVIKSNDVQCWNNNFKYLKIEFTPIKNENDQVYRVYVSRIVYDDMKYCQELVADQGNDAFFEEMNQEVFYIVFLTKMARRWFFVDYTLSAMMLEYMQKTEYICKFVNDIIYKFSN